MKILSNLPIISSKGKQFGSEFTLFLPVSSQREPLTNDFAEFRPSALPTFTHSLSPGQVDYLPNRLTYVASPIGFKDFKLLSADDNSLNQFLLSEMCASLGIKLDVVDDGSKVLDIAKRIIDEKKLHNGNGNGNGSENELAGIQLPYDALLLDLEMPVVGTT